MPQGDRGKGAVPVRVQIVIPKSEAGIFLRPEMGAAVTFLNSESDAAERYSVDLPASNVAPVSNNKK